MKKFLLSILAGGFAFFSMGQAVVKGISPASISGVYNASICETTSGWGLAMDFTIPGTFVEDTLMMVDDGTAGTNPQGNPIAQEGCSPLVNDLTGKIAVLYRNTCEFGTKAINAQNAGAVAVIIINRDNEVIAMGGGVDGPNVTIPVVMLTSLDGAAITAEMANGPVVMFIGNKAGINSDDLGTNQELLLTPRYNGIHSLLSQDGSDFNFELGMRIYNFGTATQTGATLNAKITGPNSSLVYDETVTFDLDGVTGVSVDSVDIFPGETLSLPQFSLASYPNGQYTLEYQITLPGGVTDADSADNYYSINFVVNDDYISHARLDTATNKPIVDVYTSIAEPANYTEVRYCSFFRDSNASRLAATGVTAFVSVDTAAAPNLQGKSLFLEFYEWNDNFVLTTDTDFGYTNLASVASSSYDFLNAVDTEEVYFQFADPLLLVDNQKYLVCIINYDPALYFGFDQGVDFNAASSIYGELINPLFVNPDATGWYGGGFGSDITPSLGIKAIDAASAKVDEIALLDGNVYPNPVTNEVNFTIHMDGDAQVSITDLSGRIVSQQNVSFMNSQASASTADLKSGMYIVNIAFENGSKATFNIVKK